MTERPGARESRASRRVTVVCLTVAVVLALCLWTVPIPVAAHSNHVTADSQRSVDGVIVTERLFVATGAVLVAHDPTRPGGAGLGKAVGSRPLQPSDGLQTGVELPLDDAAWADWGPARDLRLVLHRDVDGDGEYDPGDDPAFTFFGDVADANVTVAKAAVETDGARPPAGAWHVLAEEFGPQSVTNASLSVPRATLGERGHLVVRARPSEDAAGRVLGARSLAAGTHTDVRVSLNATAMARSNTTGQTQVYAVLYADDGDGRFDAADRPVRAGNATIRTRFGLDVAPNVTAAVTPVSSANDASATATDTGTTTTTTTTDTATTTTTAAVITPTSTPTRSTTVSSTATTTPTTAVDGPGPGLLTGVIVIALLAAAAVRRRRSS